MIASDISWIWIWGESFPSFCKILFGHAREFWKEPMLPSGLAPSRAKFTYRQIRTFPPWTSEILEKEKIEDEDGTSAKRKLNILCGNHRSKNVDANKGFWIKRNTKRFKWFTTAILWAFCIWFVVCTSLHTKWKIVGVSYWRLGSYFTSWIFGIITSNDWKL